MPIAHAVRQSRRVPGAIVLGAGVLLGWGLSAQRGPSAWALGGDRSGEYATLTGVVSTQYNETTRTTSNQEAVYLLDYKGGRLLATVPTLKLGATGSKVIENFAERDLVADFRIDPHGPMPHFLMTSGALGMYNEGAAPVFVFETTTRQVAVYRLQPLLQGISSVPRFDLLEVRSFSTTGPTTTDAALIPR